MRTLHILIVCGLAFAGLAGIPSAEAGWCGPGSGRSPESLQQLQIQWQQLDRISKAAEAVVTGEEADEASETVQAVNFGRPLAVLICTDSVDCSIMEKLETVAFKDEKVALGMKAFKTIRMCADAAAQEPLLAEHVDDESPTLVLMDPIAEKTQVLTDRKLTGSKIFKAMEKISKSYWKERLKSVVKDHLDLLGEQDKLASKARTLADQESRLDADDREGRKGEKIEAEQAELREEQEAVRSAIAELWKLTAKHSA